MNDAPTAVKPTGVQPLLPLSAPSVKTVVVPDVTLISSAKRPDGSFGFCAAGRAVGLVAEAQRTVLPA